MISLRDAVGKPTIMRDTAEQLGAVGFFVVDAESRRVSAFGVSVGRAIRLVDWSEIQSIGPDAVIIRGSREVTSDDDRAVSGALSPLGKRALSDRGNELGTVVDVEVDDDGGVESLAIDDDQVEGSRLEGVGSYAVVVAADPSEA
jgi:uncharacterized protein YrrD